ncbi:hypothetical protein IWX50DRAFT_612826 [Phyllosticta citricarpa]
MHFPTPLLFLLLITQPSDASPNRHRPLSPRQLSTPPPPTALTNSSFAPPLSQTTVSKNLVPNEEDDATYYLGYRAADFARPYAKYWIPHVQPISSEVQKGLSASPWAKPLAFAPQEAGRFLMQPGYLQMENGWTVGQDGTLMIAVRTAIPEITGEMLDWWFGWHQVDSARYKLWNPVAHQYAWRFPEQLDWANKSYVQRYIGTFSQIDEYIGQDANKITIAFVEPQELGFRREMFEESGVETVVMSAARESKEDFLGLTSRVSTTGHTNSTDQNIGQYLVHQVRLMDDGSRELRSRFFLKVTSAQIAHDLLVHCNIEMQHLNCFLPDLFSEFKDTL